jgi:hypothetical protein
VPPDFSGFAIFGSLAILIIVFADNFRPLALRHQISLVLLFAAEAEFRDEASFRHILHQPQRVFVLS